MKNFKTLKTIFIAVLLTTIVFSCKDDDSDEPEIISFQENINNIASNVIVRTYSDLGDRANDLFNIATNFKNDPTAANLNSTKDAWVATRSPWEQSEGFLYGPADENGIDPAIDSWPVNVVDMQALLDDTGSFPNITEAIIDAQTDGAKGFHLIEFLLWGIDGNNVVGDFTTRELEYLVAACENLKNKTGQLRDSWVSTGGNYENNFLSTTGTGNFISESSKLGFIVDGLIGIATEVADTKIEEPLNGSDGGGVDPTVEESRFSNNSKIDFANNIRSIQNVYLGRFSGNTGSDLSLTQIIASVDSNLDTRFKQEVQEAIDAVDAIPGTFTDAIINNRAAVENAQNKIKTVQETLEDASGIKATLGNL